MTGFDATRHAAIIAKDTPWCVIIILWYEGGEYLWSDQSIQYSCYLISCGCKPSVNNINMLEEKLADVIYNVALVPTKIGFGSVLCTNIPFTKYRLKVQNGTLYIVGNNGLCLLRSWKL